jgi:hypothetical protein
MRRLLATVAVALVALGGTTPSAVAATSLPLGTLTETGTGAKNCPNGYSCSGFRVACPGVQEDAAGALAVAAARSPHGILIAFSGGNGDTWWFGSPASTAFLDDVRSRGLTVILVRWASSWLRASAGEDAGPAHLACRPATVIRWVNGHFPVASAPGKRCGLCVTGNSGGASQVSYALSHYRLGSIIDRAVPTSGPPHAAMSDGCLATSGPDAYSSRNRMFIDSSFGYLDGDGPCSRRDSSFVPRWREESVDGNGSYTYAGTTVRFLFGSEDTTSAPALAQRYYKKIKDGGGTDVAESEVQGMDHDITQSQAGLDALRQALFPDAGNGGGTPGGGTPGGGTPAPGRPGGGLPTGLLSPGVYPGRPGASTSPSRGASSGALAPVKKAFGGLLDRIDPPGGPLPDGTSGWIVWLSTLGVGFVIGGAGSQYFGRRKPRRRTPTT